MAEVEATIPENSETITAPETQEVVEEPEAQAPGPEAKQGRGRLQGPQGWLLSCQLHRRRTWRILHWNQIQ